MCDGSQCVVTACVCCTLHKLLALVRFQLVMKCDILSPPGTPITRIPIMAKQPLDLCKLFKLVVERGGLVEVRIDEWQMYA